MRDRRRSAPGEVPLLLADLPVAALVVDQAGEIIAANERATLLLHPGAVGARVSDLLGRDVLWSHRDGRAQHWSVVLPGGDRANQRVHVVSAVWPAAPESGWTLVLVVAEPDEGLAVARRLPRVVDWREVAEQVSKLPGPATCILVRLVGLSAVNDEHSRSMGDVVLATVHDRLVARCPSALVARTSSDTFVVADASAVVGSQMADELVQRVREPVDVPLARVAIGCSIGVAVGDPRSALVLLDRAHRNLDRAVARGAGTVVRDIPGRPSAPAKVTEVAGSLVDAVAAGKICAHFQPVVDLYGERVVEYEALARWAQNLEENLVATDFLGAAVLTGVIAAISDDVLGDVLRLARALGRQGANPRPRVSMNVTVTELLDDGFPERMRLAVERAGPETAQLQVEVPATVPADMLAEVAARVDVIRALGLRVVLDGFGGPSSSPWLLRSVEVDAVKLSAELVTGLGEDPRAERFLGAILELVSDVGTTAIAKGVETDAQHAALVRLGCRFAQGYRYGEPRPIEHLGVVGSEAMAILADP